MKFKLLIIAFLVSLGVQAQTTNLSGNVIHTKPFIQVNDSTLVDPIMRRRSDGRDVTTSWAYLMSLFGGGGGAIPPLQEVGTAGSTYTGSLTALSWKTAQAEYTQDGVTMSALGTVFSWPVGFVGTAVSGISFDGNTAEYAGIDGVIPVSLANSYVPYSDPAMDMFWPNNSVTASEVIIKQSRYQSTGTTNTTYVNSNNITGTDNFVLFPDTDGSLMNGIVVAGITYDSTPDGKTDITGAFPSVTVDAVPTDGSPNAVSSNGVFDTLALKANLNSPTFTGTPNVPTAAPGTNNIQAASTAFSTAVANGKVADALADGVTTIAPSQNATFDALALKAPLANPALTGTPTAPTPATSDSSTKLATTAFSHALANTRTIILRCDVVDSSPLTGVTNETVLKSFMVNSVDLVPGIQNFKALFYNVPGGTLGTISFKIYRNTTNSLSGATQLAVFNAGTSARSIFMERDFVLTPTNDFYSGISVSGSNGVPTSTSGSPINNGTYTPGDNTWYLLTATLSNTADQVVCKYVKLILEKQL